MVVVVVVVAIQIVGVEVYSSYFWSYCWCCYCFVLLKFCFLYFFFFIHTHTGYCYVSILTLHYEYSQYRQTVTFTLTDPEFNIIGYANKGIGVSFATLSSGISLRVTKETLVLKHKTALPGVVMRCSVPNCVLLRASNMPLPVYLTS